MRTSIVTRSLLVLLIIGAFSLPLSPAQAAEWTVDMLNHDYIPRQLNVAVGDTVTWRNIESHEDDHTVTSDPRTDPEGPLDSPHIRPGENWSFTFTQAGDFPYYCTVHGFEMVGIVRVRPPGVPFAVDDKLSAGRAGAEAATGSVNVLANDDDLEGDTLTVSAYDEVTAAGGAVVCSPEGDCTYTAAADAACGSKDSFNYTVSDGTNTDQGMVDVTIVCRSADPVGSQVGLNLRKHLVAKGKVSSADDACVHGRTVKVQRRTPGGWKTLKSDSSASDGSYSVRLPDRKGKYRAKVASKELSDGSICTGDRSPTRTHSH